ncbi:MAG: arsenate reductase (glutaredoxin) [Flavobacterium sp.]|nr:arsenate reductase (glutaredoxin) [Flavobacterium sp.]
MITIYHNPRCGKSRECLAFVENSNEEFEVIKYLETPLSYSKLIEIIGHLKIKPIELVRIKEPIWVEKFKNQSLSDTQIVQAMVDFPILIERPIAVKGNKAVIARPMEKIKEIL